MIILRISKKHTSGRESGTKKRWEKCVDNNQSILEGLIRAMPQLTKRNQLI